jgi:hypothetical protein
MSDWFPARFEAIVLRGDILKRDDESDWTAAQGEDFMEEFFNWLDARGYTFGGAFGAPAQFERNERG